MCEKDIENDKNGENGQVFIEFILLMLVLFSISYGLLFGMNNYVAERWRGAVHMVTQLSGEPAPELK